MVLETGLLFPEASLWLEDGHLLTVSLCISLIVYPSFELSRYPIRNFFCAYILYLYLCPQCKHRVLHIVIIN